MFIHKARKELMWTVITTDVFQRWFAQQDDNVQEEFLAVLTILRSDGPNLGRPQVDTLYGSAFSNMKELRIQVCGHPYRACFAFDPLRQGIILCAGDKKGRDEKRFYKKLIALADAEYSAHLTRQEKK